MRRLLAGAPPADAAEGRSIPAAPHAPQEIAAGRFSLVGLTAIRDALGPRWEKVAPKVQALAEAVIARRIQPGDVFERVGDHGYVVLLPRLSKPEADQLCETIAREIAVHLLGTEWDALARVESVRADVPRDVLDSDDPTEGLERAFASGVRSHYEGAELRRPGASSADPSVEEPRRKLLEPAGWVEQSAPERVAPAAWSEQPHASGSAVATWTDEVVPAGPAPDAWSVQIGAEQAPRKPWADVDLSTVDVPRLSAGAAGPAAARPTADAAQPVTPEWRYAPIWDFRQQALIRFRLQATADGQQAHPYQGLEAAAAEPVLFENDLQALARITVDFAQLSAQGRRLPIICPIHYSSISLESRRSWVLHTLREVPPPLRRLLTLEIVRPHGAPWTNSLHDFVAQLRGSNVGVAACLPPDRAADIPLIAECVRAINTQAPKGGVTEKRCIELLGAFAARARQSKLESGVYGLGTRSLVVAASAAGFRFLSGEAIHPELETPDTATRFQPLDLYQASA